MKNLKSILAICTVILLLASCAKDGETGPQGPAGQDGVDGNANVNSVGNFTFDMATLATSSSEFVLTCQTPLITQDIVDNGLVIGYKKSGSEWIMLNFAQSFSGYVVNFRGHLGFERYEVHIKSYEQDTYKADLSPPLVFRLVVIDGNRLANNPDVDFSNYEEVIKTFRLKD